jgi:hypothetical protein
MKNVKFNNPGMQRIFLIVLIAFFCSISSIAQKKNKIDYLAVPIPGDWKMEM